MVRGKLTFICGGVRSGKSAYAERWLVNEARKNGGRLVYIASGKATDSEMQARIERHQQDRVRLNTGRRLNSRQSWKKYCRSFNKVTMSYGIA